MPAKDGQPRVPAVAPVRGVPPGEYRRRSCTSLRLTLEAAGTWL